MKSRVQRLNEGLSMYMHGLSESISYADELFLELCNAIDSVVTSGITTRDAKIYENVITQILENNTGKDWWEVTTVDIPTALATYKPHEVAKMVADDINSKSVTEAVEEKSVNVKDETLSKNTDGCFTSTKKDDKEDLTEATRYDKEMAKKNPKTDADREADKALNQKIIAATQSKADARKYKDDIERAIPGAKVNVDETPASVVGPNGKRVERADNGYGGYAKNSFSGPHRAGTIGHDKSSYGDYYKRRADDVQNEINKMQKPTKSIGDIFREHPEISTVDEAQALLDKTVSVDADKLAAKKNERNDYMRRWERGNFERKERNRAQHERTGGRWDDNNWSNIDFNDTRKALNQVDLKRYLTKQDNGYHERNRDELLPSPDMRELQDIKSREGFAQWSKDYHGKSLADADNAKAAAKKKYEDELARIDRATEYDRKSVESAEANLAKYSQQKKDLVNKHRRPSSVRERLASRKRKADIRESLQKRAECDSRDSRLHRSK